MNTLARTARTNATSIFHTRFPTTSFTSIARKSTLTQVFSDKASPRNASYLLSPHSYPHLLYTLTPLPFTHPHLLDTYQLSLTSITATSPHTSQAIKANGFIFLSSQLPTDAFGNLITGGVTEQAKTMIQNAKHVLEAAGSGLECVVKIDLSVKDFHMLEEIDEVFGEKFPQKPARSVRQVVFGEKGAEMGMGCVAVAVAVVDGE
jgi:2-iminobutanoate/2-iminopropanoate deaminase